MEGQPMMGPTRELCYEREPTPDTVNDILYLNTGAYHNCPLRGFIQQLMEIDAETHSQTLGIAVGILWNSRGKDKGSQKGQGQHNIT